MLYQTKNPHGGDIYGGEIHLDFSANTNPYGTPQGVIDAMAAALTRVDRYPDPYCRGLVKAIAEYEAVAPETILCGNGAAELIYGWCEAVRPETAVELAPTFAEYALGLNRVGTSVFRYALCPGNDFVPDVGLLPFLEQTGAKALILCNPNNPTGQLIPPALLEKMLTFCREREIRVLLDECFMDLTGVEQSMAHRLEEFPNVLILKAFTKSYGMAGVRLGYCLCADSGLLSRMAEAVQPWNVSTIAQQAGIAAMGQREFLEKTVQTVASERQRLADALNDLGMTVCPGSANYLLFRGPEDLGARLRRRGIAIRDCSNYHGLGAGWYRIAVRLRRENEALMAAIRKEIGGK